MARLASKEKVLFYPTPLPIMGDIISNIRVPNPAAGAILDPCCGTGEPLALLGQKLGLTTYGNEVHPQRFAAAAPRLDYCLNGAREFLIIHGRFLIIFDNPPYDFTLQGTRMEIEHMRHDLSLLALGGLAVWVVPEHIIDIHLCHLLATCCRQVNIRRFPQPEYDRFRQVVIFGIKRNNPDRVYYYRHQAEGLAALVAAGPPVLQAGEFQYDPIAKSQITDFRIDFPEAGVIMAETEEYGVQTMAAWRELFYIPDTVMEQFQPAMPLSPGHMAFCIAAGLVDGSEAKIPANDGTGEAHVCIIKGSTHKRIDTTEKTETLAEGKERQIIREKERLVHRIILFNLDTGGVREYNNADNNQEFIQFLMEHQEILIRAVEEVCQPLFTKERDMQWWFPALKQVRAPGLLPGKKRVGRLLDEQEVRAAALATRLSQSSTALLVGEMGTGKSAISAAAAVLTRVALAGMGAVRQERGHGWKIVIACPAQVVEKWKREAESVLANFGVTAYIIGEEKEQAHTVPGRDRVMPGSDIIEFDHTPRWEKRGDKDRVLARGGRRPIRIVRGGVVAPTDERVEIEKVSKPISDVTRAMTDEGPAVLILSYQTAKNAARWEHAPAIRGRLIRRVVEQEEETPHWPYKQKVEKVVATWEKVLTCPDCGAVVLDDFGQPMTRRSEMGKNKLECTCGAPLWQRVPFKYGGREAVARFLKRYAGQYDLIVDEIHNTKGGRTDIGQASGALIARARKTIALTGTVYDGKASGIFHILYRMSPEFRTQYDYDERARFVKHHGLQETITTITVEPEAYTSAYGYTRHSQSVREIAGVTPGIVMAMLPLTVFIKLHHISRHLPPYTETRLPVDVDERFREGIEQINRIYDIAVQLAREGNSGLLSSWLWTSLGWLDCPVTETLLARDCKTGEILRRFTIDGILEHNDDIPDPLLPKDQALLEAIQAELVKERGVGAFFAQVNRRNWVNRMQKILETKGIYSEILTRTIPPKQREAWYRDFVERCRQVGQPPVLLTNGNLMREGLDLVELPSLIECGAEFRLAYLQQRIRRSWRIIQDHAVEIRFLYYANTWQEAALKAVAAKLRAAQMVNGDLIAGLAEMDSSGDNLMSALMEAILYGRGEKGWSGMEIARLSIPADPTPLPRGKTGQARNGQKNGLAFEQGYSFEELFSRKQAVSM